MHCITWSSIIGCRLCGKKPVSVYYFTDDQTANIVINIAKPKDLGDVYVDFYAMYGDSVDSKKMHMLFYYDESRGLFSKDPGYGVGDEKDFADQSYLGKLSVLVPGVEKGNVEFKHIDAYYYFFRRGDDKRVFLKLDRQDGDIIFSEDDFSLHEGYKKINVKLNMSSFSYNSSYVHEIYFREVDNVLKIEVNKEAIQGTKFFTVSVKVYWGDDLLGEKKVRNGEECIFSINL